MSEISHQPTSFQLLVQIKNPKRKPNKAQKPKKPSELGFFKKLVF